MRYGDMKTVDKAWTGRILGHMNCVFCVKIWEIEIFSYK